MESSKTKVAIVTGASSGIGQAVARKFAAGGWALALGARRVEAVTALADELSQRHGVRARAQMMDMRAPNTINAFVEMTLKEFGGVDAVINCAGLALGREAADKGDVEEWMTMIETDYVGPIRLIRKALPSMREKGSGHIINIGALAALYPHPGSAVYASSKQALRAFLACVREDTLGSGVRVTNIDPGITRTGFAHVRFRGDTAAVEGLMKGFRPLEPEDVAECVWFAATLPSRVNIDQITVLPTDQTSPTRLHKSS